MVGEGEADEGGQSDDGKDDHVIKGGGYLYPANEDGMDEGQNRGQGCTGQLKIATVETLGLLSRRYHLNLTTLACIFQQFLQLFHESVNLRWCLSNGSCHIKVSLVWFIMV